MSDNTKKEALFKPPFFISYFITDPIEFGSEPIQFEKNLRKTFTHHNIDMICFRDKISPNKEKLANICLKLSREYNINKVLINSDITLCKKLGFDGIHLNSLQFNKLEECIDSHLFTVISCHKEEEIIIAKKLQSNAVTYSPIFYKEKKGMPKGITNLCEVVKKYQSEDFSILGLGGIINKFTVNEIQKTKAKGFASIRYFKV